MEEAQCFAVVHAEGALVFEKIRHSAKLPLAEMRTPCTRLATLLAFRRLLHRGNLLERRQEDGMRGISVGGGRDLELHQEDLYREHVRAAAEAEVSDIFLNRGVRHAAIVVEYLFWVAKGQVEILTRELDPLVFGVPSVVTAARRFLDRGWELPGALLRILVEDSVDLSHHPLITSTVDFSKTEVRVVPKLIQQTYQCSLIVADSKHYWFQESRDRPEAVVQFNAPETGKQFHEIFEKIWSHSR